MVGRAFSSVFCSRADRAAAPSRDHGADPERSFFRNLAGYFVLFSFEASAVRRAPEFNADGVLQPMGKPRRRKCHRPPHWEQYQDEHENMFWFGLARKLRQHRRIRSDSVHYSALRTSPYSAVLQSCHVSGPNAFSHISLVQRTHRPRCGRSATQIFAVIYFCTFYLRPSFVPLLSDSTLSCRAWLEAQGHRGSNVRIREVKKGVRRYDREKGIAETSSDAWNSLSNLGKLRDLLLRWGCARPQTLAD